MRNKINITYIIIFIFIICSFAIPKIVMKVQDKKIFTKSYTINRNIKTLNENVKNTKLIYTIYSRYNTDKYNVTVSDSLKETQEIIISSDNIKEIANSDIIISDEEGILDNIHQLIKANIVKKDFYNQFSSKYFIYRTWDYNNGEIKYSKTNIFTSNDYKKAIASVQIEKETNKIIEYKVKKEYVDINESTLRKYVKYLELDKIFNDFEYIDNQLESKLAGIKISTIIDGEYICVKVIPL